MEQILSNSILQPRFYAGMFGLSALIAGTLAVVGIYGGIAFAVSSRTREIGIRVALGASKFQVFRAIVGDMLLLAAVGIAAGVASGAMLTRYLQQMLFDLTPLDPAVFIAMPVVLASAVLGAALLSARPALTVAPLAALRHESATHFKQREPADCRLLRLRVSLLGMSRYRNLVGRISLISIISAGIRVGWRRVM